MTSTDDIKLCSFRVHYIDVDHIPFYLEHIGKWMAYRKYDVLTSSFGIHVNKPDHHFHYHMIIKHIGKKLSNPMQTMKRDFEVGKVPVTYPTKDSTLPKTFHKNLYKGRINMSVMIKPMPDEKASTSRWLQYPMKEGGALEAALKEFCKNLDEYGGYEQLRCNAYAEYQAAQNSKKQKQEREDKALNDYQLLCKHLDEQKFDVNTEFQNVFRQTLIYFKKQGKKPPTIRSMKDNAERYAFQNGILAIEDIVCMVDKPFYKVL